MRRLLLLAICLLLYASFYPWNFARTPAHSLLLPLSTAMILADKKDFLLNIWVYIPVGALAYWSFPALKTFRPILALAIGFLLSFSVEMGQFYLPTRVPSQGDILANTLGTLAGVLLASAWRSGPNVSRWMPRASIESFLLVAWLGFLLPPLIPIHGPYALMQNVSALSTGPFSWSDALLWAVTWVVVWYVIPGAFPVAENRWAASLT